MERNLLSGRARVLAPYLRPAVGYWVRYSEHYNIPDTGPCP